MISTRADIPERIWELLDSLCKQELSRAETCELDGLLRGSAPRQRALLDYCCLHTDLAMLADAREATQLVRATLRRRRSLSSRLASSGWMVAARPIVGVLRRCGRVIPDSEVAVGGLVLLAVAAAFWGIVTMSTALLDEWRASRDAREVAEQSRPSPPAPSPLPAVSEEKTLSAPANDGLSVTLTQFAGRWARPNADWKTGDRIPMGPLELAGGMAELTFDSGARVVLDGPGSFQVLGDNASRLQVGKLLAHVPDSAIGFCVKAPKADVIDLGTEFGLEVRPNGTAEVHVLEGKVRVQPLQPNAVPQVVRASEAVRLSSDGDVQFRGSAQPSLFRHATATRQPRLDAVPVRTYRYLGRVRPTSDWHRHDKESSKLIDGEPASYDHMDSRWVGYPDPTGRDDGSPQPGIRFELTSPSTINAVRVSYLVMAASAIGAPDALRIRAAESEAGLESATWQTLIGFDNQPNIAGLSGNGSGSVKIVTLSTAPLQGRWIDLEVLSSHQWIYLSEVTFLQTGEGQ